MTTLLCTRALALALLVPPAVGTPSGLRPRAQALSPAEAAAIRAGFDPGLEALRAGRAEAPAPLDGCEEAELRAAEEQSPALAEMRAGFAGEWTWFALGAAVVLLLILIF